MRYLLFTVLSFFCIHCFAQQSIKSWKDVNYAGDRMIYHKLDISLPQENRATYPVVIVIYGSAWFGNSFKGMAMQTLGRPLVDAGFAVVAPNHRSSKDSVFPAQINDIKSAIRFVRANAAKYHFDTSFIGITGFSSGGHLAALAGTSGGVTEYTVGKVTENIEGNVGLNMKFRSGVDAVVDWFGPTDIRVIDSCRSGAGVITPNSPEAYLIGGPIKDNPEKCALANPITYVDAGDPPFLIFHGDKDPLVPICQSEMMNTALKKAKVPSQFIVVPGGRHGPGVMEEKYYKVMVDFFNNQWKLRKNKNK
ncbi:prolyl oligopeptidase family serine peptidase [Arachidicoccus sp.]|uniref:prolyl oligopeptidase family serine peptidase n=1 Tax=Arachidicoccus sp. TaxID=1872624 RepID=UPI003D204BF7